MEKQKNLESILVITAGFLVLYLIFGKEWMIWIAAGVSVLSLMFDFVLKGINWLWWKIAHILGYINARILLSLVFFVFLMPVAFLQRLFTGDKLQLKRKNGEDKRYYVERNYAYSKKDLENVW